MAFPAITHNGQATIQGDKEFIAFNNRWQRRELVSVSQGGGADVGSTQETTIFKGHASATIGKMFSVRDARDMIRIRGTVEHDHDGFVGLMIYRDGAWMDYHIKGGNFDQTSGVTSWRDGGQMSTDWYDKKHFGQEIWLTDATPTRWLANNYQSVYDITMIKDTPNQVVLHWNIRHWGPTGSPIYTRAMARLGGSIEAVDWLAIRMEAYGAIKDGRLTVEWI